MPAFDGIGANEYIVDVTHDAVDFISTMDTPPVWELNIWYHTLNTGFRTRIGGETDFPCIFGDRVGLGRSYVQLRDKLTYASWTDGLRDGRAYVSDGRSHLLDFRVNGQLVGTNGSELRLRGASTVRVSATVAARLDETPDVALRTRRADEKPYWHLERARIDEHSRRAGRGDRERRARRDQPHRRGRHAARSELGHPDRAAAGSRSASCRPRTPIRSSPSWTTNPFEPRETARSGV